VSVWAQIDRLNSQHQARETELRVELLQQPAGMSRRWSVTPAGEWVVRHTGKGKHAEFFRGPFDVVLAALVKRREDAAAKRAELKAKREAEKKSKADAKAAKAATRKTKKGKAA